MTHTCAAQLSLSRSAVQPQNDSSSCVNRKAVIFEHALIATEKVMSKPVKIYLDWAKSVDISTVESAVW